MGMAGLAQISILAVMSELNGWANSFYEMQLQSGVYYRPMDLESGVQTRTSSELNRSCILYK